MTNLALLIGVLARPAQDVELPSGDRLLSLEVTVRRSEGPAEPVPVQWPDPPAWASVLDAGTEVAVLGRVRRRFFRAGGVTQSRTEVVASRVVRTSSRAKVRGLVGEAVERLEDVLEPARTPAAPEG
jgi:single-strand DNA-binding protein